LIITFISNGHANCSAAPINNDGKLYRVTQVFLLYSFILIDTSPMNSPNGISGNIDNRKPVQRQIRLFDSCFFLDGQTLQYLFAFSVAFWADYWVPVIEKGVNIPAGVSTH